MRLPCQPQAAHWLVRLDPDHKPWAPSAGKLALAKTPLTDGYGKTLWRRRRRGAIRPGRRIVEAPARRIPVTVVVAAGRRTQSRRRTWHGQCIWVGEKVGCGQSKLPALTPIKTELQARPDYSVNAEHGCRTTSIFRHCDVKSVMPPVMPGWPKHQRRLSRRIKRRQSSFDGQDPAAECRRTVADKRLIQ